jgi:hypothetical protein
MTPVVPLRLGAFAFAETGRVSYADEESRTWHDSFGGGWGPCEEREDSWGRGHPFIDGPRHRLSDEEAEEIVRRAYLSVLEREPDLGSTPRTHQRVHLVHPPDQIGPAAPQRRSLRRRRDRLLGLARALPLELTRCLSALTPSPVRIGAVVVVGMPT